jgi:hypothetical protein
VFQWRGRRLVSAGPLHMHGGSTTGASSAAGIRQAGAYAPVERLRRDKTGGGTRPTWAEFQRLVSAGPLHVHGGSTTGASSAAGIRQAGAYAPVERLRRPACA